MGLLLPKAHAGGTADWFWHIAVGLLERTRAHMTASMCFIVCSSLVCPVLSLCSFGAPPHERLMQLEMVSEEWVQPLYSNTAQETLAVPIALVFIQIRLSGSYCGSDALVAPSVCCRLLART
jgi:hypothetical protein